MTRTAPVDYFCLEATRGTTYDVQVDLGTLRDSVLYVYGPDMDLNNPIAQNDDSDGPDGQHSLASNLEFTADQSATYYLAVVVSS